MSNLVDRRRFVSLWNRCQTRPGSGADGSTVFDEVQAYYRGSGRFYHTPSHIDHCLKMFDQARGEMAEPDAVEMAIWFHDLVYDSSAKDNERRSAQRFLELAGDSMEPNFKSRVHDLIMVTVHPGRPRGGDQKVMIDIDLSSFGLPWDEFTRDSVAVREEFSQMSDAEFFPRQRDFLETLLNRDHFYHTEFFRTRHESSARKNIKRYLKGLREKGIA